MKTTLVPVRSRRNPRGEPGTHDRQKIIGKKAQANQDRLAGKNRAVLNQSFETYKNRGLFGAPDELNELGLFQTFISSSVKPNKIRDVPCMLLWAEWVRFSLKHMKKFPDVILENECKDLIMHRFGFDVMEDRSLGLVYPGIQFVSERVIA
jgi:hypothetical protein